MLFWILLLILISFAYALLLIFILPKLILKSNYRITRSDDRGLKKYKFSDSDYAIVYEPSLSARKYVTQYILAKKDGKKIFKGKIASNVSYIDFDIALFDAQEQCFSVVNAMELIGADGFTKEIDLPKETAYASVLINQVDKKELKKSLSVQVSISRLFLFASIALLFSIGMSICTTFAISHIFGGLFRETFAEKMITSGWVFLIPTLICAISITGACYILFSRNSKR